MWKITDFGLASEDSSRRDVTGQFASDSGSYRAPELLQEIFQHQEGPSVCDDKVDIWALGCIIYELLTYDRAFYNDSSVLEYAKLSEAPSYALVGVGTIQHILAEMSCNMLNVNHDARPTSRETLRTLTSIVTETRGVIWISECNHFIGQSQILTIIAPKWSHKVWQVVKWVPFRCFPIIQT